MDNDWHECVNVEQHFYVMTIKASISYFCSNAMLSFNAIAGVLYVLSDYAIHFVSLVDDYNDTLRQLPIKIQLPFEYEQSPIFELLVVILFLHTMLHVCAVAILNGLIFTLVIFPRPIFRIYFESSYLLSELYLIKTICDLY